LFLKILDNFEGKSRILSLNFEKGLFFLKNSSMYKLSLYKQKNNERPSLKNES
jgi:hypothetical protein